MVDRQSSEISFSEKRVRLLYAVLTAAVKRLEQCRDLKALVKRYAQSEDGLTAYIYVLRVLEPEFDGSGGLSSCIKKINSRTLPGKQEPQPLFDDMRSNWTRFNRMYHEVPLDYMFQ